MKNIEKTTCIVIVNLQESKNLMDNFFECEELYLSKLVTKSLIFQKQFLYGQ